MGQDSAKLVISGSTWEFLGTCWEHFGSILAHGLDSRKLTKTDGKHRFSVILGCLERGSDSKIWYGRNAGGSCGTFWRPARDSLKVSVQVGAKMGARWAKLGPSWQQIASKMGHDSAKLAILGSTWEVLGACWEHFGSILAHGLDGRKPTKT